MHRITALGTNYRPSNDLLAVGEKPQGAGIYQCQECRYEDVINRECTTLPPCQSTECETNTVDNQKWKLIRKARDGNNLLAEDGNNLLAVSAEPQGAGIYQCQKCTYEDVINRECTTLPPCQSSECKKNRDDNQKWKLVQEAKEARDALNKSTSD